jgi:hypothetical protein
MPLSEGAFNLKTEIGMATKERKEHQENRTRLHHILWRSLRSFAAILIVGHTFKSLFKAAAGEFPA